MYDSNSTTIKEAQKDGFFYRSTSYCTPEELAVTKSQTIQKSNKPVVKRKKGNKKGNNNVTRRNLKRERKNSVVPAPAITTKNLPSQVPLVKSSHFSGLHSL